MQWIILGKQKQPDGKMLVVIKHAHGLRTMFSEYRMYNQDLCLPLY